jgi:prevent-host-death family protein
MQSGEQMAADEKVSIGRVKRDVSDLVNRVAYGGARIILTSRGKPKAALVSMDDLARLRQAEEAERRPLSQVDSLADLVAAISSLPPGRDTFEPAHGSLAAALSGQPATDGLDLDEWTRIEADMRRIEADDAARDEAA